MYSKNAISLTFWRQRYYIFLTYERKIAILLTKVYKRRSMRIKFYYFKNINIKNTLSFVPCGLLCLSSLCRPVNKLTVQPIALIHTPAEYKRPRQ